MVLYVARTFLPTLTHPATDQCTIFIFSAKLQLFSHLFAYYTKKVITIRKLVLEAYYHSFPCHKSIVCCNYPDRGYISVTSGERSRQASVTRGKETSQIHYPEAGSTPTQTLIDT